MAAGLLALAGGGRGATVPPEAGERVVQLPPFFVDGVKPRHWLYAQAPGFEILTACEPRVTSAFLIGFYRQFSVLRQIAPMIFAPLPSVPTAFVLVDGREERTMSKEMIKAMALNGPPGKLAAQAEGGAAPNAIMVPQLRLSDDESSDFDLVFRNLEDLGTVGPGGSYVEFLLKSQVPRIPAWFITAVDRLYRSSEFGADSTQFAPAQWATPEETQGLRANSDFPRFLLPMGAIVAAPPPVPGPDARSAGQYRLWQCQSEVFVRWTIERRRRLRGLRRFLGGTPAAQGTEAWFKECFQLDYAQVRMRLSDYVPTAVQDPLELMTPTDFDASDFRLKPATRDQIARIWGDLERREIGFVRRQDPTYVPHYIAQAKRTLTDAYAQGERDPAFLAVLGLFESDVGEDERARGFLETATAARVPRPRAYTELARIRLEQARTKPEGVGGKLSAAQVEAVMAPLRAARALVPPQYATYILAALTWSFGGGQPGAGDWALINEGVGFFPDEPRLTTTVAALRARATPQPMVDARPAAALPTRRSGPAKAPSSP